MDLRPAVIALTLAAAFVAAPTHSAAPPEQRVSVSMSTFRFKPDEIKLVHGQPYALELVNSSDERLSHRLRREPFSSPRPTWHRRSGPGSLATGSSSNRVNA